MTNPTPHGQVPEALRLAEEISNLVCSSEAAAKTIAAAADELCRLHVEPGAVYAELPAPTASIGIDDAWHEPAMRDFADRTHAARLRCKSEQARLATLWGYVRADATTQQAAPKAAPASVAGQMQFGGCPECGSRSCVAQQCSRTVSHSAQVTTGVQWQCGQQASGFAAPQQEAQEPVAYVHVPHYTVEGKVRPVVSFEKYQQDYDDGIYSTRIPLYTAPQPAPAPLSEMPYEKQKAIQEGEQIGASDAWFKARHEMLDTVDRRNVFRAAFDRGWNAAIAAQGGKV